MHYTPVKRSTNARKQGLKDRPRTRSPRASRPASTAAGSEARAFDTQHVLTSTTSDSDARLFSPSFESSFPCQHGNVRNQAKRRKNCVTHSTRLSSAVHLLVGEENTHLEGLRQPLWNRKPVTPLPLALFITHGLFWHRPTILVPRAIVLRHWLGHEVVGAGIGVVFGLLKICLRNHDRGRWLVTECVGTGHFAVVDAPAAHNGEMAGRRARWEAALQSTGVAPGCRGRGRWLVRGHVVVIVRWNCHGFAAAGRRGRRSFTGRHRQAVHVEIAAGILIPATFVLCRHLQLAVLASPS